MTEKKARMLKSLTFVLGLGIWFGLMVGHALGGQMAAWGFQNYGRATVEPVFISFVAISFVVGVLWTLIRVRGRFLKLETEQRPKFKKDLGHWFLQTLLWAGAALLVERALVILHTELFHYFQYGIIAFVLYGAIRNPGAVLLMGTLLGMGDEYYQFHVYYGEMSNIFYDWNDCLLNLIGSAGGVLLGLLFFAPPENKGVSRPVLLACALGPLGGALLFESPWRPFWKVVVLGGDRIRRYHETAFGEGMIMLSTALAFFALLLSSPSKLRFSLALGAAGLSIGIVGLSFHLAPRELDPPTPITFVSRCQETMTIDGRLNEAAWSRAFPTRMLVNRENKKLPSATEVKLLWDDEALYIAFIVPDGDILGSPKQRDDPTLPEGEVVEVFLDPTGRGKEYLEIEVNPCNTVYDLLVRTQVPIPGQPYSWFKGDPSWNATNMKTAVTVDGTLSTKKGSWDTDKRWVTEIKIAFSDLPPGLSKPNAGSRWRANFFRVNRPRQSEAEYSCWSPSMSLSFHQSKRFGTLVFS
ncbi:MAG: carbohydrate-binding family 9-like protein, partial [Planctomycetota bacterium]|nr:carbohydrate-binding family 9-like protein [Planctomycetota bacterium]